MIRGLLSARKYELKEIVAPLKIAQVPVLGYEHKLQAGKINLEMTFPTSHDIINTKLN